MIVHLGVVVLAIGVIAATSYRHQTELALHRGSSSDVGNASTRSLGTVDNAASFSGQSVWAKAAWTRVLSSRSVNETLVSWSQDHRNLTPNSTAMIESLINGTVPFANLTAAAQPVIYPNGANSPGVDYYTATNGGDMFTRVQGGFPDVNSYVVQAGALDPPLGGQVFATPYANENSPQLVFNGTGQLALANSGSTTASNDSQFFVTTVPTPCLNGKHTICGEVNEGADVVDRISRLKTGSQDRPAEDVILESVTVDRGTSTP